MKLGQLTLLVGVLLAGPCGAAFGQATNAGDISGIVTDTTARGAGCNRDGSER